MMWGGALNPKASILLRRKQREIWERKGELASKEAGTGERQPRGKELQGPQKREKAGRRVPLNLRAYKDA